ncbi:MAG: AsmA family protein [Candidatus Omnitrophota bacterium]|nr:AsmA family protein [Candidatus Omnitrophota bacterium]MDZ4242079.1 AsmA family protein [Candidatus Omnitrophota bacterium]
MKILKMIGVMAVVLVLILCLGAVAFIKTLNVNKYKPQIVSALSGALGRDVDFRNAGLEISWRGGVRLRIQDLAIREEAGVAEGDFLRVKEIFLSLDVAAYLLQKEIKAQDIDIQGFQLILARRPNGMLNVQTIGQKPGAPSPASAVSPAGSPPAAAPSKSAEIPAIHVHKIGLEGGTIVLMDQTSDPALTVEVSRIDLTIREFSTDKPFDVSFQAAVWSELPNISVNGTLALDLARQRVEAPSLKLSLNFSSMNVEKINSALKFFKGAPLAETLGGVLEVELKNVAAGTGGIEKMFGDILLKQGQARIKDPVSGLALDVPDINLSIMNFSLAEPFRFVLKMACLSSQSNVTWEGKAMVDLESGKADIKDATLTTDLSSISLEKLRASSPALKDMKLPDILQGKAVVTLHEAGVGAQGLESLNLDAALTEGRVVIKDASPGVTLDVSLLDASVKHLTLENKPFAFKVSSAVWGKLPSVTADGYLRLDTAAQKVLLEDSKVNVDLSQISMDQVKSSVAALKDVPLPENLRGQLRLSIKNLAAGPQGIGEVLASGELFSGSVKLPQLAVPVENIKAKFNAADNDLTIDDMSAAIGKKGTVTAKATVKDFLGAQNFHLEAQAKAVRIEEVMDQSKQPVKAEGAVFATVKADGSNLSSPDMLKAVTAEAQAEVRGGRLKDLNVLKAVLDAAGVVPGMSEKLEASLPEEYKAKLQNKDTEISRAQLSATMKDGQVSIAPLDAEADGFLFKGQGTADVAQSYAIDGSVLVANDLSMAMAGVVPELQYFYNDRQEIAFLLKFWGQGPQFKFSVDIKAVTKNAIMNKGKEEFRKVLDKVLGTEEENPQTAPEGGQPRQPANTEKRPEEQILEGILDSIFK